METDENAKIEEDLDLSMAVWWNYSFCELLCSEYNQSTLEWLIMFAGNQN